MGHIYVKEPSVLILKEKHGDRYFYIPDEAALHEAALEIVTERGKKGYYGPYLTKPEDLDFTEEDINKLPALLQKEAGPALRAKLQKYKNEMRAWRQCEDEVAFIKKTVEMKHGENAYEILHMRDNAEYERTSLERFEKKGRYRL
jgi:hypothetical protein